MYGVLKNHLSFPKKPIQCSLEAIPNLTTPKLQQFYQYYYFTKKANEVEIEPNTNTIHVKTEIQDLTK